MTRKMGTGILNKRPIIIKSPEKTEFKIRKIQMHGGAEIDPIDFVFCFFCMPCYNHQKLHDDYATISNSACRTLTGCYALTCCYSFEKLFHIDLCPCIARDRPVLKTDGINNQSKPKKEKKEKKKESEEKE